MNFSRKCIISAVTMFIMAWALSFFVHAVLLGADYAATAGMRKPEETHALMHWMILAQALFGAAPGSTTRARRTSRGWRRACASASPSPASP